MKILMVSIFAPHFFNWTEQLRNSGHEVYWLDVFDSGTEVEQINFVHQIIGWRYRWDFPGRYYIKKNFPWMNKLINYVNERRLDSVLERELEKIQPDVVHSFVMYLGTAPILPIMKKHPKIKWIYSSWGSDLYYYRNLKKFYQEMNETFPYINFMFADCQRDYLIAVENGFTGKFLGVFPGGGGFDLELLQSYFTPWDQRNIILIKGYQGKHGKCIEVLKSLLDLQSRLESYELVIFGAAQETVDFIKGTGMEEWPNMKCLEQIPRDEVLQLMGGAKLYVGNSTSDGIPNTLLEAIIMGAFPIQSNPGGATGELIENGKNGILIVDPEDVTEIKLIFLEILENRINTFKGVEYNSIFLRPLFSRDKVKKKVLKQYKLVENSL